MDVNLTPVVRLERLNLYSVIPHLKRSKIKIIDNKKTIIESIKFQFDKARIK